MDYIELSNLDLSDFDNPESRKKLARQFYEAFTQEGFVTVSGHGISKQTWDQQIDLCKSISTLPLHYVVGTHSFKIDFYNMLYQDSKADRKHPPHLVPYLDEIREVMLRVRDDIQKKLFILLAMCLEMPVDELIATHAPGQSSSECYRYVCEPNLE